MVTHPYHLSSVCLAHFSKMFTSYFFFHAGWATHLRSSQASLSSSAPRPSCRRLARHRPWCRSPEPLSSSQLWRVGKGPHQIVFVGPQSLPARDVRKTQGLACNSVLLAFIEDNNPNSILTILLKEFLVYNSTLQTPKSVHISGEKAACVCGGLRNR